MPIHVLTKAISKVDKKDYPIAFVWNTARAARFIACWATTSGAYAAAGVGELFRRGTAWAARLEPAAQDP